MTPQRQAYFFAGATVLLWSTVASAFKLALQDLNVIQVLFFSSLISTLALFFVLILQNQTGLIWQTRLIDLRRSAVMGLLNPFLYYLVLFKAYALLPAQEAQCLNWTWPITLTLMSALFLHQKLRLRTLFAIIICFCGVLVIATRGQVTTWQFASPLGTSLAVGSSLLWAGYWILNLKDDRHPVQKLFWNFLCGTIYVSILVVVTNNIPQVFTESLGATVWIGLFEMSLAFVLWLRALSLSRDSASVGVFAFLTPFVSLVFIYFILGEAIRLSSILGLTLIIGGILLSRRAKTE